MLKRYDEALDNIRKGSQFPDSQRGCHVFKLLKDEDYDGQTIDGSKGEPSKREPSKGALSKGEPSKGALSKGEPSKGELSKGELSKRKARKGKKKKTKSEAESEPERDAEKEEMFEFHKMVLFNEKLPSKDTQFNYKKDLKKSKKNVAEGGPGTTTAVEEPVPVQETIPVEELEQVPKPEQPTTDEDGDIEQVMTESSAQDKFRDGVRRIDLVLVAVDDGEFDVTEERNRYLHSILKAGLQIETAPGVMSMNRNLVFIKIHAPDSVLDEYNHAYGTKKYFRDEHLRFVKPGLTFYGLLLPCSRITHERELISLVRDQYEEPLRLSNAERSLIVYKILLELPFGVHSDNFGLDRLLSRRIVLDAFALHDSPHFIFPSQDWKTISARQYLFYNWVGKINAYKVHPLNLIREYFGERIGMYFAFYEFFNHALMIAAIFGVILYLMALNDTTDNFIVPEYIFDNEVRPRSTHTGLLQNYVRGPEKEVRTFLIVVQWIVLFAVPIIMVVPLFMHKQNTDINLIKDKVVSLHNEEIAFAVIFAIKLVCVQILSELIYRAPIYFITKVLENHLTYESQARSFMFKTFMTSFLWTFPIMFYYAWLKGAEYYLPVRVENYGRPLLWSQFRGRYSFTHCGPFTCLDEVFFVLLATILIRHMAIPFLMFLKGLIYNTLTEYNQGPRVIETVPTWEREFRLEPVTEAMMARKFNVLLMQFALVTLVGAVFPLAPLLILIRNFCDIRYEARMFVQWRRRPLLLGNGLGVWTPILQHLAFLSVPANALTLARTTKTAARNTYMYRTGSMKGFLFYSLYLAEVTMYTQYGIETRIDLCGMWDYFNAYKKKNFVPKQCYFPGLFTNYPKKNAYGERPAISMSPMKLTTKYEFYLLRLNTNNVYLGFSMVGLMYAVILNYAVPPYSSQLNNIMELEMRIKNAYIRMSNLNQ